MREKGALYIDWQKAEDQKQAAIEAFVKKREDEEISLISDETLKAWNASKTPLQDCIAFLQETDLTIPLNKKL